ncbi:MAG: acyltransferase [Oscillospiraceae bacterium]|nr:acyltransferase [Oscillospiraceae bacterium]
MDMKRVWYSLRLWTFRSPFKRADYLRKHHVYAAIGTGCSFQSRKVPLYPNLIQIGDHVRMAGNVSFLTHDMTHHVLNKYKNGDLRENVGCIRIGNNVFVSSGVIIHNGVSIGDNVIIGAGCVVESDVPSNSVVGGVPAKVKCSLDVLYAIRKLHAAYPEGMKLREGDFATSEAAEYLWSEFDKKHPSK